MRAQRACIVTGVLSDGTPVEAETRTSSSNSLTFARSRAHSPSRVDALRFWPIPDRLRARRTALYEPAFATSASPGKIKARRTMQATNTNDKEDAKRMRARAVQYRF